MNEAAPRDYSLIAPYYDRFFQKPLEEGHQKIGELLVRLSGDKSEYKVLEVGVGSGLGMNFLPENVQYTGIDINEQMIELARKRAISTMDEMDLILMDAKELSFQDESFNLVVASSVLSAMDDPMKGMSEMIRVTKKGGMIAIIANLREKGSATSDLVRRFDPVTRKFLGFRLDLELNDFLNFQELRLVEKETVNRLFGMPLSTYMLFEKI